MTPTTGSRILEGTAGGNGNDVRRYVRTSDTGLPETASGDNGSSDSQPEAASLSDESTSFALIPKAESGFATFLLVIGGISILTRLFLMLDSAVVGAAVAANGVFMCAVAVVVSHLTEIAHYTGISASRRQA